MPRVKRGVTAHARHKKVLDEAKGYYGARSKVYRVAKQAVIKAGLRRPRRTGQGRPARHRLSVRRGSQGTTVQGNSLTARPL